MAEGALVLLYHRVAELDRDPYEFAVHPDRFAQHCDILGRCCHVVPLRETDGTSRQVAITFDDGYADNAAAARSVLAAAGLPATFFISVARIGERAEIWWDRLERILLDGDRPAGHIEVDIDGCRLWADTRSQAARVRAHWALYWRLRPLRPRVIESILSAVEAQLGVQSSDRDTRRWMTPDELRALASTPRVDIGAHSLTHPLLASLTESEQWQEIDGSRRQLEQLVERRVDLFSYPFGGHEAFDGRTTALVQRSGYRMAVSGTGGLATPDCYPFAVPRNVVGDWEAARFEQTLDRWLHQV